MNEESNEIVINIDNKMTARYSLIGYDNSEIFTEIDTVAVCLSEIETVINIRPQNRMWALFEVEEPPILKISKPPLKDAFVTNKPSEQFINFGKNTTLAVGNSNNYTYDSYLQFDLSNWQPLFQVVGATLRFYFNGIIPNDTELQLIQVDNLWQEYGITELNKPNHSGIISNIYSRNTKEGYIEFEITEQVLTWISRPELNFGLVVQDVSNNEHLINLRARESTRSPQLNIRYYDARIYSTGRSQVNTELFVWQIGNSEVSTEIEVKTVIGNSDIETEIYVHQRDVPVDNDKNTLITITRPEILAELIVALHGDEDIESQIDVCRYDVGQLDTEITVNKPNQEAEIFVKYYDSRDIELTVQRNEVSYVNTTINVSRESIQSDLFVKYRNDIDTEIIVEQTNNSDVETFIAVSKESIPTEIFVNYTDFIETEITARLSNESNIDVDLTVSRESVQSEVYVRAIGSSEVDTEITYRATNKSELDSTISVSRESIETEITVTHYSQVDAELYVKYRNEIESVIDIKVHDNVESEIDIKSVSQVISEITVTRRQVYTQIIVPYWDDNNVQTEIRPRILRVDNIETEIRVRTKSNGSYAFIM